VQGLASHCIIPDIRGTTLFGKDSFCTEVDCELSVGGPEVAAATNFVFDEVAANTNISIHVLQDGPQRWTGNTTSCIDSAEATTRKRNTATSETLLPRLHLPRNPQCLPGSPARRPLRRHNLPPQL
jgi:hypothetical protein